MTELVFLPLNKSFKVILYNSQKLNLKDGCNALFDPLFKLQLVSHFNILVLLSLNKTERTDKYELHTSRSLKGVYLFIIFELVGREVVKWRQSKTLLASHYVMQESKVAS